MMIFDALDTIFSFDPAVIPGGSYLGIGDIDTYGATWGLRAYSAAQAAAAAQALIKVRRISDGATADLLVATDGGFGVTANVTAGSNGVSIRTWAGTATTGTGSIAGTALTFAGGTIGSQVSGGTVSPGTLIISGTSPTWTVNISQTVASSTLTVDIGLRAVTAYDLLGTAANNLTQATANLQPMLALAALGTKPALYSDGTMFLQTSTLTLSGTAVPYTVSSVAKRTGSFSTVHTTLGGGFQVGWFATSGSFLSAGTAVLGPAAADNVLIAMQGIPNGASSTLNVNGTTTSGMNCGTTAVSAITAILADPSGNFLTGFFAEGAIRSGAQSGANQTAISAQQLGYWL